MEVIVLSLKALSAIGTLISSFVGYSHAKFERSCLFKGCSVQWAEEIRWPSKPKHKGFALKCPINFISNLDKKILSALNHPKHMGYAQTTLCQTTKRPLVCVRSTVTLNGLIFMRVMVDPSKSSFIDPTINSLCN